MLHDSFYNFYDLVFLIIRVKWSLQLYLTRLHFHPNDTNYNWKIENKLPALWIILKYRVQSEKLFIKIMPIKNNYEIIYSGSQTLKI